MSNRLTKPLTWRTLRLLISIALTGALSGCVLAPREAKNEKEELRRVGRVAEYQRPFEKRELPELPPQPHWQDVLRRSLLANGELEAAYHEWAAAVHRIQQAGGYPNTPLSVGFEQMFEGGTKVFDNTSVSVGPDAMENLAFPPKIYQAAKVATHDAQAAGKRFLAAKFDVQRRVLNDWFDYALLAERLRIQRENVVLLRLISDTASARVRAGGAQQDLLRAETAYRLGENDVQTGEADLPQIRARLNAMMDRAPDAPLEPPTQIPPPRPVAADDAALLALAAENNPDLAVLARQVRGRRDALELARLQYIPDFNPFVGITGSVSQVVGLGISIPTFLPEVQGMVREARADLRGMMAMYRQTKFDRAAAVVAALYALRNSERQTELFSGPILRSAEGVLASSRLAYSAGTGTFIDFIDAQRTLLDVRLLAAEARAAREKSLADLEALVGLDVETLAPPPATQPATRPRTAATAATTNERMGAQDE